ncbi:MAG: hypothetical protein D6824_01325 [Planctomycetota bacterium]|nr:MAG: hypothetical protein D6824_01325 [Planctomycetota bacterium]
MRRDVSRHELSLSLCAAALALALWGGHTARASLDQLVGVGEDPSEADPPMTLDTRTGLTWLDIDKTVNLSFFEMQQELQPGGQFFGFRHATPSEVLSLWETAGILDVDAGPTQANVFGARGLMQLLGMTESTADCVLCPIQLNRITGMTSEVVSGSVSFVRAPVLTVFLQSASAEAVLNDADALVNPAFRSPTIGHYLVQAEVIPSPGGVMVAGPAWVGLLARRRRRARGRTVAASQRR